MGKKRNHRTRPARLARLARLCAGAGRCGQRPLQASRTWRARLCALACALALCVAAAPPASALDVSAESAVLYDAAGDTFLYEKNADARMLMASITKMMTALVVLEQCNLEDVVAVPASCVGVEGSSMSLEEGEQLTVEELIYGMLLLSGNDAAAALAVHTAGSIEDFAALMNGKAEALGLQNSHFANPHGLNDDANYASARDLAYIAAEAMRTPTFRTVTATKTIQTAGRDMRNHNKLLWDYEGTVGGKTGYTIKAGRCLVSMAERNGRMLIAVTLKAPDDWNDHKTLYDMGFAHFTQRTLCAQGEVLARVPVVSGLSGLAPVRAEEKLTATLSDGEWARVETKFSLPWFAWAPVFRGDAAGRVRYVVDGRTVGETRLYYETGVEVYLPAEKTLGEKIAGFFGRDAA
ncbi:MAG: D-alanyl-D-alanine carboxypeptidase [Oscillospiraceae bacterium]|jgi:D-alanyl-D-alanine carboxypeptidase|nr:D-alanyl-D-alanine carboxypeptidase [Oscillospiraceae bacterium]